MKESPKETKTNVSPVQNSAHLCGAAHKGSARGIETSVGEAASGITRGDGALSGR
jgi:hypothetical protein